MRRKDVNLFDSFINLLNSNMYETIHLMAYRDIAQTLIDQGVDSEGYEYIKGYSLVIEEIVDMETIEDHVKEEILHAIFLQFESNHVERDTYLEKVTDVLTEDEELT